jgi:hypothetical protein
LPDPAWQFLYEIYGGLDIKRFSIEIPVDDGGGEGSPVKKEYMIEIFYKKLLIYILPKVTNHLCLKKPSGIFISRRATINDFRRKIAEILYESKK